MPLLQLWLSVGGWRLIASTYLSADTIGDATPVEQVEKIARLYMLVILGASNFRTLRGTLLAYNTWRS
ncbi:hypothetical protein RDI58_010657 [Solanum bulbocastanum]|uniref:Uncharacterized protein n=1 Tax=Solanum bulbocastanum TaxID=147425 RepID=A0AAN8YGZ2_SOLBU